MVKELEDLKDTLLNSYGFIGLTFFNVEDGFKFKIPKEHQKQIEDFIDRKFQIYRDTWLIPRINFVLEELRK